MEQGFSVKRQSDLFNKEMEKDIIPDYSVSVSVANAAVVCINTLIYGWSSLSPVFAVCAVAVIICAGVSLYSKRFHMAAVAVLISLIGFIEFPLLNYHYGISCAIYYSLALIGIMFCLPKRAQIWFTILTLLESVSSVVMHYALSYFTAEGTPAQNMFCTIAAILIILVISYISYASINKARTEHANKLIDIGIEMENLAIHDKLTGAYNRVNLYYDIQQLLDSKDPFCIGLFDIDGFKKIDDTYGHQYGDDVLHACAQAMIGAVNENGGGSVFRFGGDEFLLLFESNDNSDIKAAYESINDQLTAFTKKTRQLCVTISGGIVRSGETETIDDLIRIADTRLYEAKGNGKNCLILKDK